MEFISLSKSLALNQHQEVIQAVLKSGEYQLKEIYSSLQVTGDRWYQMSEEQKMRHLKKVMETLVTCRRMKRRKLCNFSGKALLIRATTLRRKHYKIMLFA